MLRKYEEVFQGKPSARSFVLRILSQAGDQYTVRFLSACLEDSAYSHTCDAIRSVLRDWSPGHTRPLQQRPTTPSDLDLLWAEFFVSGDTQAVLPIIDVLERPDGIRGRLGDYLRSSQRAGSLSRWKSERTARGLIGAGILVDTDQAAILSSQDLDCYCALEGGTISRDRIVRFRRLLPFSLSDADLNHMVFKAAAKWSLGANAREHPLVLQTCELESAKRAGGCRLSLLEIAAYTSLAANDMASAFNRLSESVTIDALERKRQNDGFEAELQALEFLPSMRLATPDEWALPERASEARRKCADVTASVSTYRSELSLRTEHASGQDTPIGDGTLAFRLEFVKPDRYRVTQNIGRDFDEWVTVCGKTFRAPAWTEQASAGNELKLNELLLLDRYLAMLRQIEQTSAQICQSGKATYLVLNYDDAAHSYLPNFLFQNAFPKVERAVIVIDLRTSHLVKAEFHIRLDVPGHSAQSVSLIHSFGSFNAPITVVLPAFQLLH